MQSLAVNSEITVHIPMLIFLTRSLLMLVVKALWPVLSWNLFTSHTIFPWEFLKVLFKLQSSFADTNSLLQKIYSQVQKHYIWACFFISSSQLKLLSKLITKITAAPLSQLLSLLGLSSDDGAKAKVDRITLPLHLLWCILGSAHGKNPLLVKG